LRLGSAISAACTLAASARSWIVPVAFPGVGTPDAAVPGARSPPGVALPIGRSSFCPTASARLSGRSHPDTISANPPPAIAAMR
jgi:hypothetical protein